MRIVIAEDNVPVAEGLAHHLRRSGHEVTLAFDGEVALRHLSEQPADVLVLDYGLPKVDGALVLKTVRARTEHLPVMLFSALDDAEARLLRQGLRVEAVLTKPFGLVDFDSCLQRIRPRSDGAPRTAPLALADNELQVLGILQQGAIDSTGIAQRLCDAGVAITSEAVEHCIERLRCKLADRSLQIVKVRGLGYVLVEPGATPVPSVAA